MSCQNICGSMNIKHLDVIMPVIPSIRLKLIILVHPHIRGVDIELSLMDITQGPPNGFLEL